MYRAFNATIYFIISFVWGDLSRIYTCINAYCAIFFTNFSSAVSIEYERQYITMRDFFLQLLNSGVSLAYATPPPRHMRPIVTCDLLHTRI